MNIYPLPEKTELPAEMHNPLQDSLLFEILELAQNAFEVDVVKVSPKEANMILSRAALLWQSTQMKKDQ